MVGYFEAYATHEADCSQGGPPRSSEAAGALSWRNVSRYISSMWADPELGSLGAQEWINMTQLHMIF